MGETRGRDRSKGTYRRHHAPGSSRPLCVSCLGSTAMDSTKGQREKNHREHAVAGCRLRCPPQMRRRRKKMERGGGAGVDGEKARCHGLEERKGHTQSPLRSRRGLPPSGVPPGIPLPLAVPPPDIPPPTTAAPPGLQ